MPVKKSRSVEEVFDGEEEAIVKCMLQDIIIICILKKVINLD